MPTAKDILSGNVKPDDLSDDDLEGLPHSSLQFLRSKFLDQKVQQRLAPFEHQAFAREYVNENPITGTTALMAAVPGYYLAKLIGAAPKGDGPQTGASSEQLKRGFKGIAQGLGIL